MSYILVVVVVALLGCHSFTPRLSRWQQRGKVRFTSMYLTKAAVIEPVDSLEIIIFGLGDLRADDHEGLRKSLEKASISDTTRVIPLVVLDQKSAANFPGAVAHTHDTARLLAEAIHDLMETLNKLNLPLHVDVGSKNTLEAMTKVLGTCMEVADVRVHVCDHGLVDNAMQYSPYANLKGEQMPPRCTIVPWSCELRNAPWENLDFLPETYDEYTKKFNFEPSEPMDTLCATSSCAVTMEEFMKCPTADELSEFLQQSLGLNRTVCQQELNTGLYGTHWGGLDTHTAVESKVLDMIRVYVDECKEDDTAFAKKVPLACTRNNKSLEHATMVWNLRGDGTKSIPETKNILAGELLCRYLLAPLLLGTVSPRRLWYSVKKASTPFFVSPLRTLVETREWHQLFATKRLLAMSTKDDGLKYKYWRWHGFLCRYGEQTIAPGTASSGKEGILLIHGFGASANQWQRSINALQSICTIDTLDGSKIECLAPDLIGFGQSEKPSITYSGFTWESYASDFIKEIACHKKKWHNFVVGGNSIGGFVAMCSAANDATTNPDAISGCGGPGTGRCTGTILMNPAGVIQGKDEVAAIEASALDKSQLTSVAQMIAGDGLAPCK